MMPAFLIPYWPNEKTPEIILMTNKKMTLPSLAHPPLLLELLQWLLKTKKKTTKNPIQNQHKNQVSYLLEYFKTNK